MSRISRYQESIEKFIKNKNKIENFKPDTIKHIKQMLDDSDQLCGIVLSTILNYNTKKTKYKSHGYYLAFAVNLILIYLKILENKSNNTIDNNIMDLILMDLLTNIYGLINDSCGTLKQDTPEKYEEIVKIILYSNNYFNKHISNILDFSSKLNTKKMIKSDILNIKDISENKILVDKLSKMVKLDIVDMKTYIYSKYGTLGKIIFMLGWVLGGGLLNPDNIKKLESMGEKFGVIYKLCRDFQNIVSDLKTCSKMSYNMLINCGINESFILFMNTKTEFIEESMALNLYTHTTKEVIDSLEKNIDNCLEKSNIDMKSSYSSFSCTHKT